MSTSADKLLALCWDKATGSRQYVPISEVPVLIREFESILGKRPILTPEQTRTLGKLSQKQPWLRLFKREFAAFFLQLVRAGSVEEFLKSRYQLTALDVLSLVEKHTASGRGKPKDFDKYSSGNGRYSGSGYGRDSTLDFGKSFFGKNYDSGSYSRSLPASASRPTETEWRSDYNPVKKEFETSASPDNTWFRWKRGMNIFDKTQKDDRIYDKPDNTDRFFSKNVKDDIKKSDDSWFKWKDDTWFSFFPKKSNLTEDFSAKQQSLQQQVAQLTASLSDLQKYTADLESKLSKNDALQRRVAELDSLCSQYEKELRQRPQQVSESKIRALRSAIESQDQLIARLERRLHREGGSLGDLFTGEIPVATAVFEAFKDAISRRRHENVGQWLVRVVSVVLTLIVFSSVAKLAYLALVAVVFAQKTPLYVYDQDVYNDVVGFSWLMEYPSLEYAVYQAQEWMGPRPKNNRTANLVHLLDQVVDELLSVTSVTTLDEVEELSLSETTGRVGQLEWPQEVVDSLEVRTNGEDLVDQVLDGDNTVLAQSSLDDLVVSQSDSLSVDLTVTSLVDQLSDGSQVRVTVGDVRLGQLEQLSGGLGDLDENTGVDLGQSEQLQHLSWLRWQLVDTLDSDDEDQLWLGLDVVRVGGSGLSLGVDDGTLSISVLLVVSSSSLSDGSSSLLVSSGLVEFNKNIWKVIKWDPLVSFEINKQQFVTSSMLLRPERWLTERQHRYASHFAVWCHLESTGNLETYLVSLGLDGSTVLGRLLVSLSSLLSGLWLQSTEVSKS